MKEDTFYYTTIAGEIRSVNTGKDNGKCKYLVINQEILFIDGTGFLHV